MKKTINKVLLMLIIIVLFIPLNLKYIIFENITNNSLIKRDFNRFQKRKEKYGNRRNTSWMA